MDVKRSRILLLAGQAFARHAAVERLHKRLDEACVEKLAAGCSNELQPVPTTCVEVGCEPERDEFYYANRPVGNYHEANIKLHVAEALKTRKPAGFVGYSNSRSARRRHW